MNIEDVKVNYFDLGLYNGKEIQMMIDILGRLGVTDYHAYGFEAHPQYAQDCKRKYANNPHVRIIMGAISSKAGNLSLHLASNPEGHSIYASKHNIKRGQLVETSAIVFSEWLAKSVPDFRNDFNILKANIEGAEWDMLKDLDGKDLLKYFRVFCGSWGDVTKIGELQDQLPEYYEILEKNEITPHRFTYYRPQHNADIPTIVAEALKEYQSEHS